LSRSLVDRFSRPGSIAVSTISALLLFGQPSPAQTSPLAFFKNYFVTGDYVASGVGLRGLGDGTGFATGNISIGSVPPGGEPVAAFLYWQTVEKAQSAFAGQNGFFNGYAISGKVLGNPNAPVSWSAGGCAGSSQGTTTLRSYRADVRPYLAAASATGNGSYTVRLADSGSNGGTAPLTLGATLVLIYRVQSPAFALKAISLYDGTFAPSNSAQSMDLTIDGFYQADTAPNASITHIVGNGQPNKTAQLLFNGTAISNAPFPGALNGSWDNPTFTVSSLVPGSPALPPQGRQTVTTDVIPASTNKGCVSWGAVVFGTTVKDFDKDGLLDIWETGGGYTDISDGSFVSLPGADASARDLFVQVDYLETSDYYTSGGTLGHSHLPKIAALDKVGNAFKAQGIHLHVDCGNCYPPSATGGTQDPFIISGGTGGHIIFEDKVPSTYPANSPAGPLACQDNPAATPPVTCQFPGQPAIGWKSSLAAVKNQPMNNSYTEQQCETATDCIRRFAHGRKDSYHYVLAGHVLGLTPNSWSVSAGTLVSIVNAGGTATVTTTPVQGTTPPWLTANARVGIAGALGDFDLNGSYVVQSKPAPTATTFTIHTVNVTDGTYDKSTDPGLSLSAGPVTSTSGWSDLGGGDTAMTLGLWRSDIAADDQVGSAQSQAGTLMHELGHTLGLTHGGFSYPNQSNNPTDFTRSYGVNCKPNFQSVMNYEFQIRGLTGGAVDFSGQTLGALSEGSLNEATGLGVDAITGLPPAYATTRWYAPLSFLDQALQSAAGGRRPSAHCDGTPLQPATDAPLVRIDGAALPHVDWDNDIDGAVLKTNISQDANFSGAIDSSQLTGFNDWAVLDLRQIGARKNAQGFSTGVWGSADLAGGGSSELLGGGSADLAGGGSSELLGGGSAELLGGGGEVDFELANATVDPPSSLTSQSNRSVTLNWTPPDFGQIRTYLVWRATGVISPANLPKVIARLTGAPPATTFTDTTVKNKTTYTYFVTDALGNSNQSGTSNIITVAVVF
jgi:hypothetical protein